MPPFGPTSRRRLIGALLRAGFSGPLPGGKHEIMVKGTRRLVLPNPHMGDIDRGLLARLVKEAGLTRDEWEAL